MNSKKWFLMSVFLASLLIASDSLFAQRPTSFPIPKSDSQSEQQTGGYYRLDFIVRSMDAGKATSARNYSLWMQAGDAQADLKAVNEVPYASTSQSINYRSVGTEIICMLKELEGKIRLSILASISEVVSPERDQDVKTPVFHNIHSKATTLLELEKPTIISSIDDATSKRRIQIEVTATKLK
jgi:hypothetical protein